MQDRPFALLGVNCDNDPEVARKEARREELTWPIWSDPGEGTGPICTAWGQMHWPALFVLDHRGTIRYRHLPPLLLDEAVGRLLRELEGEKHAS
jgi:hypothetical protein